LKLSFRFAIARSCSSWWLRGAIVSQGGAYWLATGAPPTLALLLPALPPMNMRRRRAKLERCSPRSRARACSKYVGSSVANASRCVVRCTGGPSASSSSSARRGPGARANSSRTRATSHGEAGSGDVLARAELPAVLESECVELPDVVVTHSEPVALGLSGGGARHAAGSSAAAVARALPARRRTASLSFSRSRSRAALSLSLPLSVRARLALRRCALSASPARRPWSLRALVVFVCVYCSCTRFGASSTPRFMLIMPEPERRIAVRSCSRKMLYASARECLWMIVLGPPRVLPLLYGSGMCRMFSRCCSGFAGSAARARQSAARRHQRGTHSGRRRGPP
jgi:hypothetical protein